MRIFIILLVVANLLFMVVNYLFIGWQNETASSKRLRKVDGHSLILRSEQEKSRVMAEIVEQDSEETSGESKHLIPCLKIVGDWDLKELSRVKERVQTLDKTVVLEGKVRKKKVSYWVVIPSFDSKQEAIKVKNLLQNEKIVDTFIIRSGARENAISLGLYSREESAQKRAGYINAKQIRSARATIEELSLYVDRRWIKVAPVNGDLESILSILGKGVIDTEAELCEIGR